MDGPVRLIYFFGAALRSENRPFPWRPEAAMSARSERSSELVSIPVGEEGCDFAVGEVLEAFGSFIILNLVWATSFR